MKAEKEAEKRVKEYDKQQKKIDKKAAKPVSQAPNFSSHTTANRNKNLPGGVNRRLQQRNNKFEDRNSTVSGVTYANKYDTKDGAGSDEPRQEDSIGSAGSLNGKENPFDEQDLPSDDEAQEPDPETSALHLFLTSAGIPEFIPTFVREQIDLTALELLTEEDLIELEVPLGPRKKLQKALRERKQSLEQPGEMVDTQL
ncbi:Usher syndrome type-1G [Amphibalanus amphitrite]|uniref:Usher syndrome type-1G n=1 Tax=Amphibalanus amphitrite TaxID=1232801 RepID=A0A6A4W0U2_AMPAM|nr:Usher syndrome type-1G [Amphibalanus amphitrite]